MLVNILLLHYNNYYNRIVKKEASVADYKTADTVSGVAQYKDISDVNFTPHDGVSTKLVVGTSDLTELEENGFDYLVVYNKTDNNIFHRWFIMDIARTRKGQYELTLRRDVIVDFNETLIKAPIFVEKAYIKDEYSPFLYNNENVNVNQIKTEEHLLKDGSYCPWLVLYLKKKALGNTKISTDAQGDPVSYIVIDVDEAVDYQESIQGAITTWQYYKWCKLGTQNGTGKVIQNDKTVYQTFFQHDLGAGQYAKKVYEYKMDPGSISNRIYNNSSSLHASSVKNNDMLAASNSIKATLLTHTKALDTTNYLTQSDYQTLYDTYNNKVIKDGDGKYFKATVKIINNNVQTETKDLTGANALFDDMTSIWQSVYGSEGASNTPNNNSFKVKVAYKEIQIQLEEQLPLEETVDFAGITNQTVDSPLFDAISIPYGDFIIKVNGTNYNYTAEKSLKLMNEIARQLSSQWVLDLQLLPYCPFQGQLVTLSYVNFTTDVNVGLFGVKNNERIDFFPIVPRATFSFDIFNGIGFYDPDDDVPNTYKIKYYNDCTMLRLCSPNYAGVFEFNLAKNSEGYIPGISYWNVDMTLRPYNPYIHVNPEFGNLYGQDWDDSRGLVCGGDFSLGIINDAWVQYEIQNKNYQAIFDRQIENLDVNNKINRDEAGLSALLGVVQGGARGGIAGAMAGGGIGAAVGAGAGAVVSALGGLADVKYLEQRQAEARDFAIDNYNLQLGNVRALPNSITKTSSLTANNKLFPFVEVYKCTEQEKQAYFNKLKYDGMTVGIIDTMENYIISGEKHLFRGQLIRNEEIKEDNHMVETINEELKKGVYI